MTTPANPGMASPVSTSTLGSTVEKDALTGLALVGELAPGAIGAAVQAQTAVAAQTTTLGKAEAAASSAFSFALPILNSFNPALGAAVGGIVSELQNIENAISALTGHVAAANTAVLNAPSSAVTSTTPAA